MSDYNQAEYCRSVLTSITQHYMVSKQDTTRNDNKYDATSDGWQAEYDMKIMKSIMRQFDGWQAEYAMKKMKNIMQQQTLYSPKRVQLQEGHPHLGSKSRLHLSHLPAALNQQKHLEHPLPF